MIATTRGLLVLAVSALALLVLSFVMSARTVGPIDRSLIPRFDDERVSELVFTRGTNAPLRITRAGTDWRWQAPPGIADPATIDAVLSALRGGRWHRREAATIAGPARAEVTVDGTKLSIRNEVPGTAQTWVVRGNDALLVDSWIATALAPEPLMLRMRHPLACTAPTITAVTVDASVRIAGTRLLQPRELWLDERWLQALADVCVRLEIVSLVGKRDGRKGLRIIADGELIEAGSCQGGRIFVDTASGEGCVEAAAVRALTDALRDPTADLRPLPIDAAKLTLQDGTVLDVAKKRIGDTDADPERVRELISALMTRGTAQPRPVRKPSATITAVDAGGTEVVLELFGQGGSRMIARRGEPVAIEIEPKAWTAITRPSGALRDPIRWREDPTTIASVTLDDVTYKRGAVLGEWFREPAGKVDPTLIEALVETLSTVRAPTTTAPRAIAHRLRVTISPPAGAPIMHSIELAAPTAEGCAARLDSAPVLLPLPLCTAVIALATQR